MSRKNLIRLHTTLTSTPYNIVGINWNANCEANLNIWHHRVTLMSDLCPISVCSCGLDGRESLLQIPSKYTFIVEDREKKSRPCLQGEKHRQCSVFLKYMFQVFWFDWGKNSEWAENKLRWTIETLMSLKTTHYFIWLTRAEICILHQ